MFTECSPKEVVTIYFNQVKQLRVAAKLPPTATNSGGPVGTLQADRAAVFTASGFLLLQLSRT
jgi:hypothetical protein